MKSLVKRLPVPLLPTLTGLLTLANVYGGLGFTWVRHVSMWLAASFLILYFGKIIFFPQDIYEEYQEVVPSSLYAGLTMTTMILANYLTDFSLSLGRALWLLAVIVHITHILVFTFQHGRKHFRKAGFLPSWFVTYNGLTTAVVVGGPMGFQALQKGIAIYCVGIYLFLLPWMLVRLYRDPITKATYHTQAIILAPVSLSIAGILTVFENPWPPLVMGLYLLLLISLAFVICKLPSFLSFDFTPAFAGLTFPMAIGTVASGKMSAWLEHLGYQTWSQWVHEIQGLQVYLTTVLVGYVFIRLLAYIFQVDQKIRASYD